MRERVEYVTRHVRISRTRIKATVKALIAPFSPNVNVTRLFSLNNTDSWVVHFGWGKGPALPFGPLPYTTVIDQPDSINV